MMKNLLLSFLIVALQYRCILSVEITKNKIIDQVQGNKNLELLLSGILNHLILSNNVNCLTVICDSTYLNIFNGQWFKRINSIPIIMIVVDEPEDLLSPNFNTLESIRQSRKDDCKLYIIFIANGIQASRFLIFGDRYRLIDTRANFIMHHDLRLFIPTLHYIWKRIINIVFIRHHHDTKRIRNNTYSWYELSTVPFPYPIKNVLVPQRIMSWKTNTIFKPSSLFPDKTQNLKGHLINAVTFQHVPAVVKVQHPSNKNKLFNGMEIEIMETMASVMNFKTKVYEPLNSNFEKWGRLQLNGSYTGLLGEMVDGKADIALGNLHYTPYHLQLTDLSIPYITECLTFLTPESLSDNSWKTLILPFKLYMWIAVLSVLMVSGVIFYLLAQFHKRIENYCSDSPILTNERNDKDSIIKKDKNETIRKKKVPTGLYLFEEFTNSVLYTFSMLLVVSLPRLPTGWSIRLLTGWYWLYCVLVVTSYRASMTAILANPVTRVTIDTMEQLADSSISCGGWGTQSKDFFTSSLDETSQKIGKKFESVNNAVKSIRRIIKGDFAYYDNMYFLKYLMSRQEIINKQKVKNKDVQSNNKTNLEGDDEELPGDRNLHIMKECAIHMPVSIGLQKNSPLKLRIDKLLRKLIEAGLIEKWLNDAMVPIYSTITMDEETIKAEMNLKKLYAGFVALGIGYGLSVCVLIAEILHWKYVVLKDPKFDVYARYDYFKTK